MAFLLPPHLPTPTENLQLHFPGNPHVPAQRTERRRGDAAQAELPGVGAEARLHAGEGRQPLGALLPGLVLTARRPAGHAAAPAHAFTLGPVEAVLPALGPRSVHPRGRPRHRLPQALPTGRRN